MPSGEPSPPKVLGVLAGRDLAPGALEAWLAWADRVVAADGGADLCRAAGREPDAIVGDLDSIADPAGLTRDEDQDTSDADKLLAYFDREETQDVMLIGVEGDRLDHVVATLYSCARSRMLHIGIVLRQGSCVVLNGAYHEWRNAKGRVSLLPLGRCRVDLEGVRWPIHGEELDPHGLVSLSNEIVGDEGIGVQVWSGSAALFLLDYGVPGLDSGGDRKI